MAAFVTLDNRFHDTQQIFWVKWSENGKIINKSSSEDYIYCKEIIIHYW